MDKQHCLRFLDLYKHINVLTEINHNLQKTFKSNTWKLVKVKLIKFISHDYFGFYNYINVINTANDIIWMSF